jgi:hypothetical protein
MRPVIGDETDALCGSGCGEKGDEHSNQKARKPGWARRTFTTRYPH